MSDTTKLLERIQQLEAYCTDYANDLAILEAENDQLHNILDALREPSAAVVKAAARMWRDAECGTDVTAEVVRAAVAAAEQEVGHG